ncbi:V-type immunoglobulin domain-containing suppressor of T-cell activation [Austrofundulus limnaeus]|uniref:V-type immunoglobulin domain-containing suppressor of T-cell activation n=1 Tax=Austrofundulus limnaeus TaxID=52670 RepID=UPI0006B33A72|nr:PREDICTED: platelet receptor Gi24 [Austrofundulus limnaeus]
MARRDSERTSVWRGRFWLVSVLFATAGAKATTSHQTAQRAPAPHMYYACPEGATARVICEQAGANSEELKHLWLFTPYTDEHCKKGLRPRNLSHPKHPSNHSPQLGLDFGHTKDRMWVTLTNVTHADQGRYCCLLWGSHKHEKPTLEFHSYAILHVFAAKPGAQNCTVWNPTAPAGSVPVALALAACILALLSLPVILVLVYKQRQSSQSNRRAQELVRMDSEAQGHDNPVFLGSSPQVKTRTVSQIMTRQSSETGRHLLSDPGTPLSPAHGDVFFPSEDPIPESPDLLQI